MKGTGVAEPMDLIHKALEQLDARNALETLEAQTDARLSDLLEEEEQLMRRREKSDSAVALASAKRLERLHELVTSAERELARATASLAVSDSSIAAARKGVAQLDEAAAAASEAIARTGARSPGYVRIADPAECDSSALPALMQSAIDTIVLAVRAGDAKAAEERQAQAVVEAEAARVSALEAQHEQRRAAMEAEGAQQAARWSAEEAAMLDGVTAEAAESAGAGGASDAPGEPRGEPMFPPLSPSHLAHAEMA